MYITNYLFVKKPETLCFSCVLCTLGLDEQEAILDVNPDEAVDMAKKQRLLHWDSRKKKFVKTTLAELSERKGGGSRKIRTESGKRG